MLKHVNITQSAFYSGSHPILGVWTNILLFNILYARFILKFRERNWNVSENRTGNFALHRSRLRHRAVSMVTRWCFIPLATQSVLVEKADAMGTITHQNESVHIRGPREDGTGNASLSKSLRLHFRCPQGRVCACWKILLSIMSGCFVWCGVTDTHFRVESRKSAWVCGND